MQASPIFLFLPFIAIAIAGVGFWYMSKKAPKGATLILAIAVWVLGNVIGFQQARELKIIGGSIQMAGFVGVIVGLIDTFRKRKT